MSEWLVEDISVEIDGKDVLCHVLKASEYVLAWMTQDGHFELLFPLDEDDEEHSRKLLEARRLAK